MTRLQCTECEWRGGSKFRSMIFVFILTNPSFAHANLILTLYATLLASDGLLSLFICLQFCVCVRAHHVVQCDPMTQSVSRVSFISPVGQHPVAMTTRSLMKTVAGSCVGPRENLAQGVVKNGPFASCLFPRGSSVIFLFPLALRGCNYVGKRKLSKTQDSNVKINQTSGSVLL